MAPMPESRNTGATESWMTWAIAAMPESCCIADYRTAPGGRDAVSPKNRVRNTAPRVHADARAQRAHHEGRHRADAGAEPPADRPANGRADKREEFGHGLGKEAAGTARAFASLRDHGGPDSGGGCRRTSSATSAVSASTCASLGTAREESQARSPSRPSSR